MRMSYELLQKPPSPIFTDRAWRFAHLFRRSSRPTGFVGGLENAKCKIKQGTEGEIYGEKISTEDNIFLAFLHAKKL